MLFHFKSSEMTKYYNMYEKAFVYKLERKHLNLSLFDILNDHTRAFINRITVFNYLLLNSSRTRESAF